MSKFKIEFGEVRLNETSLREVMDCLSNNKITMGEKVERFEEGWGKLFNYKYNVCVNSGTSADFCALLALYELGAKPGDEVILPGVCFIACSEAIVAAGFEPVWVDIDIRTQNIDLTKIQDRITSKTRAILAVNNMGKPCNMEAIRNICDRYGLILIGDNCEGHGSTFKGKYIGHWSDMACYSFYAAHLIFGGELGMVSTNREDLYLLLKSIRTHGRRNGGLYFDHDRMGWNAKPTDIHASIALGGIEDFWSIFNKRKRNIHYLKSKLAKFDYVWFNEEDEDDVCCPHAFSIVPKAMPYHEEFSRFKNKLTEAGIHWKRNFGCPPIVHKAFSSFRDEYEGTSPSQGPLQNSWFVGEYGIHMACHQFLTQEDLDYMVKIIQHNMYRLAR